MIMGLNCLVAYTLRFGVYDNEIIYLNRVYHCRCERMMYECR